MAHQQAQPRCSSAHKDLVRQSPSEGLSVRRRRQVGRSSRSEPRRPQATATVSAVSRNSCVALSTRSHTRQDSHTSNIPNLSAPEGSLFPLEDRDFAYSPFSTSTTDHVDSDYSVYTPTKNKRRRGKKYYSFNRTLLKRKSNNKSGASSAKKSKYCSNETPDLQVAQSSGTSKRSSGSQKKFEEKESVPSTYLLRSRGSNVSTEVNKERDTSLSSTASDISATKSFSHNTSSSKRDNKSRRSSRNQTNSSEDTPKVLGSKVWKTNESSNRNKEKRKSQTKNPEREGARRSTRSSGVDMPQQSNTAAPGNTKRDKKGKGSLGSCASSGGSSAGGRRAPAAPALPPQSTPSTQSVLQTSAIASTSNTQPPNMNVAGGGGGTDSKVKVKEEANSDPNALAGGSAGESSSDDTEVGRLQALLEARGLPPHLLGALGPRVQHLLHRTMGSTTSSKAAQLLSGLQATGDEGQQLQAVIEMCQLLVMGNEDTLAGFPVRQVVPALITLLGMEHNFDMMNHACRALTYMMESLPHTSGAVALAVPVFLDKLQAITCMDVAEQSLTALDMLSRRHSKPILQARGVSACLMYLDFFSINAQRAALSITSNCCQNLQAEEFVYVSDSLPLLANRLTQQDKKSVESVCLAFSRLVESFQNDPARLQEIASTDLLTNLQQLLVVSPPIITPVTFISVLRMLSIMCSSCPELAVTLFRQNIADTLLYLLTGSSVNNFNDEAELVPRTPPELYEITCLIAELMPRLPNSGLFTVDSCLERSWGVAPNPENQAQWQWRDDTGNWHSYTAVDSRIIEAAHLNSEDEVSLSTLGRTYIVDFLSMKQINEDTGTTRPVQRRLGPPSANQAQSADAQSGKWCTTDARNACLRGSSGKRLLSLSGVLLEVYSSSAGPAVRCQCLKALLRMVYHSDPDMLTWVLKYQVVSSHIAGMMASNDLRIVVGSLQLAEILMQKLPDVFGVHFRREGVMHQIKQLADPSVPLCVSPPKSTLRTATAIPAAAATANVKRDLAPGLTVHSIPTPSIITKTKNTAASNAGKTAGAAGNAATNVMDPGTSHSLPPTAGAASACIDTMTLNVLSGAIVECAQTATEVSLASRITQNQRSQSPVSMKLSDVLKRKRAPKRSGGATGSSGAVAGSRHRRQEESQDHQTLHHPHGSSFRSRLGGATFKTSSFLASLNPARWARQHGTPPGLGSIARDSFQSNSNIVAQNREKARQWVRTQASSLCTTYGNSGRGINMSHPASGILVRLTCVVQRLNSFDADALTQLKDVLVDTDISPFEVNHSGLVGALLNFLTSVPSEEQEMLAERDTRLRAFLNVFADLPIDENDEEPLFKYNPANFLALVNKMNACVSQLEQFPVRVHDLPARPSTSALKFFNTHQLKCNLQRHPSCVNLKQWKGGTVKIDPLALVQAIERYLVVRGYARQRDTTSSSVLSAQGTPNAAHQPNLDSDDDNTDEDFDESLTNMALCQGRSKHKLQFLIGETVLPYNMTVYQAVRQFSPQANDQSETDTDTEAPLGNAGVWVQTHTIYYRSIVPDGTCSSSGPGLSTGSPIITATGRKGKGTSTKSNSRRKTDDLWNEGVVSAQITILCRLLSPKLPSNVTITDAALSALALLRCLHSLSRHWYCLYKACPQISRPILPQSDFVNSKLAAKASRQLQDPLVIMTGNLPQWLHQIASACPFLFPFETRQLLFYAVSFDRDRALQRLLDSSPELNHGTNDSSERVTPRLDRRKRTVSRNHILKQAEQVMQDFAHSKALLEIKYENEVGTGLGPTLEFYTLVSLELQRADLDLWHGSENFKQKPSSFGVDVVKNNQPVIINDPADSPPPVDPATNLASSVFNNLNLTEEHNRNAQNNANVDNFESFDMPMILDSTDVNLNSEVISNRQAEINDVKESQLLNAVEISYVNLPCGLFPQALGRTTKVSQLSRIKAKFRFLGKFMAKAVMDSRMLDLPFSLTLYRWLVGEETCLGLTDIRHVAPELWRSLCRLQKIALHAEAIRNDTSLSAERKKEMLDSLELDGCCIEDLGLDFILPGHSCTELRRGGRDLPVTAHNLGQYISLVTHWLLYEGIVRQMDAFKEGFESVFPLQNLKMFYPEELESIFCGSPTGANKSGSAHRWEARMLAESCRIDHGFTVESRAIRFLLEILSSYDVQEQRLFLQFITGSPRLPTGGFKALSPPLTIVRKTLDPNVNADDYLPSVMTCVNYLKLPDYSSIEVMRTKLRQAASEGQHSFHLS